MNTQQLDLLESLGEGEDVEFKTGRGGLPGDLWETYSAFANTSGGTIYLGVREKADRTEYPGVKDAEGLVRDFWNSVNNPQKISVNLLSGKDIERLDKNGQTIVAIHVPRAPRNYRPVHIGPDPYKGTYRRDHEGDFKCRHNEVRRMLADQSDDAPADSRILEHFALDDFDEASLRQFRNRMSSRQPNHPWLSLETVEFLTKLGGWRRDRTSGLSGPTVAGLLMFGQTDAITDNEVLPGFHLDYRERLGDGDTVRWTDRLTIDGTWEANLFQFYMRVVQKIHNDNALKIPFERDADGYRKGQSAVHEALQEALVNALIHADHAGQGGVIVDRFANRFEFSNPGMLLLPVQELVVGGVSECRNRSLQKMFQMLGAGDKAGSGLDKIRTSWQAQHWQSPTLKERVRPDRVILSMPLVSILPSDMVETLKRHFGETAVADLMDDEIHTLVTAALEGAVTNLRLQQMLTRHRVDITQMLGALVSRGMLRKHGRRRGASYTVAWHPESDANDEPDEPSHGMGLSPSFAGGGPAANDYASDSRDEQRSSHNDASSLHNDISSLRNDTSSLRNDVSSIHNVDVSKPKHRLLAIAEPVRSKRRAAPDLVERTILELCASDYLSLHELSELLRRNATGLHTRYLNPLLHAGYLALRFPDKPNHSQQAYRTVEQDDR